MRCYVEPHVAMSRYLVIAVAILAVCSSAEDVLSNSDAEETGRSIDFIPSNIVNVSLYYESLCYDSIQFVKNQLVPTYRQLGDYFTVTYIPYGKASHQRVTDGNGVETWQFTCQHGSSECFGNKAQACAIDDILTNPERTNKQQDQVNLVGCVMAARNPSNAVPGCLQSLGIDANHRSLVNNCISSTRGNDLLAAYGDKTFDVQPNINFVPTIVINGVFSHEIQRSALRNFKSTICSYIPSQSRPTICNR